MTGNMAERVGFEPTLEFPLNTLSKRAPSATRPSLRRYKRGYPLAIGILRTPSCRRNSARKFCASHFANSVCTGFVPKKIPRCSAMVMAKPKCQKSWQLSKRLFRRFPRPSDPVLAPAAVQADSASAQRDEHSSLRQSDYSNKTRQAQDDRQLQACRRLCVDNF